METPNEKVETPNLFFLVFCDGSIAQLVEHRTENPCVGGSSPPRATIYAAVAQLVRAPGCGPGGRWFKSSQLYHIIYEIFFKIGSFRKI